MCCLLELLGLLVHPNFLTPIQMSNTDPPHTNFDQVMLCVIPEFSSYSSVMQPHGHQFEFSHTFHADMALVTTPASEPPCSYYYSESSMHELHSPTVTPSVSWSTSRSVSTPNIELTLNLIVLDAILNGTPWDSDNIEPSTLWNDNIWKLFINQIQTFHSKMAKTAETYTTMYNLSSVVNPNSFLQPMEKSLIICTHYKDIFSPHNWQIYYLHDFDPQMLQGKNQSICQSNFLAIPFGILVHKSLLPHFLPGKHSVRHNPPPVAVYISCCTSLQPPPGLAARRYSHGKAIKVLGERSEIIGGMEKTLHYECPDIGRAFEQLLHKIHEDGLTALHNICSSHWHTTIQDISCYPFEHVTDFFNPHLTPSVTRSQLRRGDNLIIFNDTNVADGAAADGELDPVGASEANEASPNTCTVV
ncbi:hypothetical protein HD554DRAFT_2035466 [Boletus coccyginus]|nr:hypothetical protein HD554DRAFT_2035466 [Boletus coccyginus]